MTLLSAEELGPVGGDRRAGDEAGIVRGEEDDRARDLLGLADAAINGSGIARETAKITRGQAFIWAANLFHGGSAIADPARTRLSQVTHYYFRGCSYFTPLATANDAVFWREPYDIAAGRFVANAEPSHRPRLKHRIGERLKIWTRRPHAV